MSAMYEQIELKPDCGVLLCDGCGILVTPFSAMAYDERSIQQAATAATFYDGRHCRKRLWLKET